MLHLCVNIILSWEKRYWEPERRDEGDKKHDIRWYIQVCPLLIALL